MTPTLDEDVTAGPALFQAAVRVADHRWAPIEPAAIADIVLSAVAGSSVALNCPISCDILFTDDAEMASLNGRFRHKDSPTNVLAFPSGETLERGVPAFVGGVAISFDRVSQEAIERTISVTDHATHLTLHGVLHLVGFDHETEIEREEMERVEVNILAKLGVANPYEGS